MSLEVTKISSGYPTTQLEHLNRDVSSRYQVSDYRQKMFRLEGKKLNASTIQNS